MLLGKTSIKKPQKKIAALLSNNFGGNSAQSLLDGAPFYAQLTKSLVLNRGTGTPTYTRATTAVVKDHEGVLRTVPSGCARFEGARFVRNLLTYTEDLTNAAWTKNNVTITGTNTVVDAVSTNVHRVFITGSPTQAAGTFCSSATITAGTRRYVVLGVVSGTSEVWAAVDTQTWTITQTGNAVGGTYVASSLTANGDGSYRLSVIGTLSVTGATLTFSGSLTGTPGTANPSYLGTGATFIGNKFQLEDITGRADQTTPSEYVSVGVLSAPYHGAGVDGVKYFDTDLSGNPIAASVNLGYVAEGARTNLIWPSEDLTHVRYVSGGGGIAVVADQAVAPDGTTTADQLTASGANGTLIQDLGVIASAAQAFSLYLKRKTGAGNIDITLDGGATWTTQTITTTEWTRCQITQTLANPDVGIRIVTSGDAIYAWGLQCE